MRELICPICKKIFIPAPYHIYVKDQLVFCGWKCYNSKIKVRTTPKTTSMKIVMKSLEGDIIKIFESANVAAEKTGFVPNGIRDACREKRPYMKYLWEYL